MAGPLGGQPYSVLRSWGRVALVLGFLPLVFGSTTVFAARRRSELR